MRRNIWFAARATTCVVRGGLVKIVALLQISFGIFISCFLMDVLAARYVTDTGDNLKNINYCDKNKENTAISTRW
jgi:hypothetical protein